MGDEKLGRGHSIERILLRKSVGLQLHNQIGSREEPLGTMRNGTAVLTKVILATILKVGAILVIAFRIFQATSCNNQDMMHDLADDNSSLKRLAMALLAVVNLCL